MPTISINVTLPTGFVETIDRLEPNRDRLIAEAVEHELTRRRRNAFLQSVQNPHPESSQLVDRGEWISDVPSDDTLVDARAGTPVRWIEGVGWTEESA